MPPEERDDELLQNFEEDIRNLRDVLGYYEKKFEELEREKENFRKQGIENEQEHLKEIEELEKIIGELKREIEALCQGSPIHVGTLIRSTKKGFVLIYDNHKVKYEVPVSPKVKPEDLEEGSEVRYIVDPMSGKPLGVFDVRRAERSEEIIKVEELVDENTALVLLPGDTHKLVNIAAKIKGQLKKGDNVYYNSAVSYITGKVPEKEGKADLPHVEKKSWEDIGGLKEQVQKVREVAELPLNHPELFEGLGIAAPRGILLSGPPGCGKTLIGKILANETNAYLLFISGPEIVSSYVGESEATLRALFEKARREATVRKRGAIIFFDEIEAISEKRDEAEHSHERRLVSQLLALMDGLTSMEHVIVIAATNKPELLDEALRRPGRFDREIVISPPDRDGRLEILKIHSRSMHLHSDVSLEELADITHGFTGADLEGLCREAAMQIVKGINLDKVDSLPQGKLKVAAKHFMAAFAGMKPSVMREVTFQKPTETWADVGGLEEVKRKLEEAIKWPLMYPELLKYAGHKPSRGILLYGHAGCGKTLIARALSNECGVNFIPVKGPELLNKYVGESESNVRKVFKRARQSAPCVIFFDEIDALVSMRGMVSGDAGVSDKVTAQLLTEFDGIESMNGVFILAATNRLDLVDPALLRPGRFDYKIEIPPPGKEARMKIFEIHTKGRPLAEDVDLKKLVGKTEPILIGTIEKKLLSGETAEIKLYSYFTGAEIANVCHRAGQKALREFVDTCNPEKDYKNFKIFMKHFEESLREITYSVEKPIEPEPSSSDSKKRKRLTDKDIQNAI